MTIIIFIAVWLACGVIAAGIWVAYFRGKFPKLDDDYRESLAQALLWGFFGGPVALLLGFFLSGFLMYGWTLLPPKRRAAA